MINHAASKPDKEILIISAELTKMRLTVIKDFVKVMKMAGIYDERRFIAGTLYRFANGSFIKFIGLDKQDVGKGLRSDIVYFNEVNKCDSESYRQVATRAGKVISDYNPDAKFFIDTEVIGREDCDFLQLTFEDNELLGIDERNEILNYKRLGYNEDGSVKNSYWANIWRVYGLGEVGALQGVVFSNWSEIESVPPSAKMVGFGMDFGYTNDPTTCIAAYEYNGQRIYDELIYQTGLLNGDIAALLKSNGISKQDKGYADCADPKSIDEINRYGFNLKPVTKGADSIAFGISIMQGQPFQVTKRSANIKKELNAYCWDTDKDGNTINKPIDAHNHAIDAMRYVEMMLTIKPSFKPFRAIQF
jgi:phage terminase large subunit